MARGFDESNRPEENIRSIPFGIYFGEMELSKEQVDDRVEMAEEIKDMIIFLLALISTMIEYDSLDKEYIFLHLNSKYSSIVGRHMGIDEYLENYIYQFSENFLQTTIEHIEDTWYLSTDRAIFIGENESNNVFSHNEYIEALRSGKTKKEWITMRDKRVRHSHKVIDGKLIEINKTFSVGDSFMNFPRDEEFSPNPQEVISCRCSIKYY